MNEFSRIAAFFAPLATSPGAFALTDDAALLDVPMGKRLVVTQDTLVETIHFMGNETPDMIARKALRVNLSDLAAKGATPYAYFLSLSLPARCDDTWLALFSQGLKEDQAQYAITLLGGDTTATPSHLVITITALGLVEQMVRRSGAKVGDGLYVSGTIGDAYLGLQVALGQIAPNATLLKRYQLPEPRNILASLIRDYATACLDISDGLLQDTLHLCRCSGVRAVIDLDTLPLSEEARLLAPSRIALATGGDDYELVFTAPAWTQAALMQSSFPITKIGDIIAGDGLEIWQQGKMLPLPQKLGYQHGGYSTSIK